MADYGLGIGLSGKLTNVERQDEAQRNRDYKALAAQGAAAAKQKEAAQKNYDDWSKLIANNNPNILPVYTKPTSDISIKLISDMTSGVQKNPMYTQSPEFLAKIADWRAKTNLYEQVSEGAKKAIDYASQHPDDAELDPKIAAAINDVNYDGLVSAIGDRVKQLDPNAVGVNTDMLSPDILLVHKANPIKLKAAIENAGDPTAVYAEKSLGSGTDATGTFQRYQPIYQRDARKMAETSEYLRELNNSDKRNKQYDKAGWEVLHGAESAKLLTPTTRYAPQGKGGLNIRNGVATNDKGNVIFTVTDPNESGERKFIGTFKNVPYEDNKLKFTQQEKGSDGKYHDATYYVHKPVPITDGKGNIRFEGDYFDDTDKDPVDSKQHSFVNNGWVKVNSEAGKKLLSQYVALTNNTVEIDPSDKANPIKFVSDPNGQLNNVTGNLEGLVKGVNSSISPAKGTSINAPKKGKTTVPKADKSKLTNTVKSIFGK